MHDCADAVTCDGSAVAADYARLSGGNAARAPAQAFGTSLVFTCLPGYGAGSHSSTITYRCGQNGTFATADSCAGAHSPSQRLLA